jgi:GTP-binding protein
MMKEKRTDLRNIAIIAHVDHGKTTLVDGMLKQARIFRENQHVEERVMDSNDLERERGITILAKNTAISIWDEKSNQQVKINIVDTPGHADFGGEVERVMNMVDGVLLLVDAAEGPMPQTRFVLKKALEMGHQAVVVINKVDRRGADPEGALNKTFDLFIELGASESQADFPVVYTQATEGRAGLTPKPGNDLKPLFDTIMQHVPCPEVERDEPMRLLVTALGYDDYRGVTAVGRISSGMIKIGQPLVRITLDDRFISEEVRYLYVHSGLDKTEVESAEAGEIIVLAGLEDIQIGETLADAEVTEPLPRIHVEEPTVRMTFGVNTSPFAGREGRWGTSRHIRARLFEELRANVALKVEETETSENFLVSGRGELHLAILIETMRREGYEFQVSRPEVIFKTDVDGRTLEPFEEVHIETSAETTGTVVEMLGKRRGRMVDMRELDDGHVRMVYIVPTRGMLGFRYHFMTATRGLGVMNTLFHGYQPLVGEIASRTNGSLVAWENGTTNTYGLKNAEDRGVLFYPAGVEVYEGMVVGEYSRNEDLTLNVCKKKQLTNMRQSNRDIDVRLSTPRVMSLDEAIEYLANDELLEVTPAAYRIRKRILNSEERTKQVKKAKELLELN